MPEHERAFDNGCVYEHILVAEKMLGRKLKKEECVHHKDKDRTNNLESNLMVFKTSSDHAAYHNGAKIYLEGDVWVASHDNLICPICGNKKSSKAKMCIECLNKHKAINIPLKEELEPLIYKFPFVKIGKMFSVSDNAVRKWCIKYNLPYKRKDIKKRLEELA